MRKENIIMKKSLVLACLVSALAASSFAQSTPSATPALAGARLVAERDSPWLRNHPARAEIQTPMAHKARRPHVYHLRLPRFHRVNHTRHVTKR